MRLDTELQIVYGKTGLSGTFSVAKEIFEDVGDQKTSSDVYFNMWRISYLLDALLGSEGFSPTDVYGKAQEIVAEMDWWRGRSTSKIGISNSAH